MTHFDALKRALALLLPVCLVASAAGAAGVEATAAAASSGPFGLEVAIGVSCTQPELDLTSGDLSGPYEACNEITATGVAVPSEASLTAGAATIDGLPPPAAQPKYGSAPLTAAAILAFLTNCRLEIPLFLS